MNYKLDHIAFNCKDLSEAAKYYENHFGGKPTPIRKAGDGHGFCFINISGAAAIQLIESQSESGINHYGFVTDDVEQVARELKEKNAEIIREIRDAGVSSPPCSSKTAMALKWKCACRADPPGLAPMARLPSGAYLDIALGGA